MWQHTDITACGIASPRQYCCLLDGHPIARALQERPEDYKEKCANDLHSDITEMSEMKICQHDQDLINAEKTLVEKKLTSK